MVHTILVLWAGNIMVFAPRCSFLFFGLGAVVKRGEQTKDKSQCRRQNQQEDYRHLNGNKQEMGLDRASVLYDHNHKRTHDYQYRYKLGLFHGSLLV
jgi:hypothetical protein